jgi:hypothetical protein
MIPLGFNTDGTVIINVVWHRFLTTVFKRWNGFGTYPPGHHSRTLCAKVREVKSNGEGLLPVFIVRAWVACFTTGDRQSGIVGNPAPTRKAGKGETVHTSSL